jgi:hypothetical protein
MASPIPHAMVRSQLAGRRNPMARHPLRRSHKEEDASKNNAMVLPNVIREVSPRQHGSQQEFKQGRQTKPENASRTTVVDGFRSWIGHCFHICHLSQSGITNSASRASPGCATCPGYCEETR